MKVITSILFVFLIGISFSQLEGTVRDNEGTSIPFVKIHNLSNKALVLSNEEGEFTIKAFVNDTIKFTYVGFDTTTIIITNKLLSQRNDIRLFEQAQDVKGVIVTQKRLADFDVGYLPKIKGVQIYTGTNSVIELAKLNGAKSTANPREIFAKVPGLNIWESDGAGIQMGIGGRGLSPNRTANFNTRQNGYDISADALGYPESYYTPPIEALKSIEIIRGSAALQFGTQFGGLLNFIIKDAPVDTPLEFTTRNTVGTYGYLGTFNRITGSKNRLSYQVYHQYKRGSGYRDNSQFGQHQAFVQAGYYLNENIQIRLEYTHMNYLAQQAGGLSDLQFEENPRQSFRDRNWFNVNWNMLALHYDHTISSQTTFNIRAFGMTSERKTLGFLGKITQSDPGGVRDMLEGQFRNAGIETRLLHKYQVTEKMHGAFLVGGRYYRGNTISNQGKATDGDQPEFSYQHPNDLENSSYTYPSENAALFAENILFITPKWTVNFGGRFDFISSGSSGYYKQYVLHPVNHDTIAIYTQRDSNTVLRKVPLIGAGSSYKIGRNSSIYANYTQNYRAINFTDIRISNPNIVVDSTIKDEYGYTAEIGFRGLLKDYFIYDIAGFYIFYGDKIGVAPKPGTILKERTNIGDARNLGIELFMEFDFLKALLDSSDHSFSWFVNTSYIHSSYITSKEANYVGKQVEYVSPIIARSGLRYRYKGLSFQIQGSYNSEQFADASNSVEPSGDAVIGLVPAYYVVDASIRYTFEKHFQVEFGINNLTNNQYFTRRATAYPGPGILPSDGINGYLTLQYQFKMKRQ